MIVPQLTHPKSIVVVGGSNDTEKPGGKILKNIIDGGFKGDLFVINPKEDKVQGIKSYRDPELLPKADLAIIAIAAKYTPQVVEFLSQKKHTRAFIIISAGFSEESAEGKRIEDQVVDAVEKVGGSLIGPNCVGVLTPQHHSVFTLPIPELDPHGCDFISGSGATACFIMEAGIPKGLRFANVFSVGNSAQMGVEDILKYMDEHFDPERDSKTKLLYFESIEKPDLLLKHASSLISKGCKIAAVKAGTSEAGSRAATSHTGALANSDLAVDALFKKAGIVRCYGREDLISVAMVFQHPDLTGKNFAVITHAGGPAVMITDALSEGGLEVPAIEGKAAEELKEQLFPGSSVSNPIDFLATGNAAQLGLIIDHVNNRFDHIDAMVVIFGTPGLFPIHDVYEVLDQKMRSGKKPIYPVLPSVTTAKNEIDAFVDKGNVYFSDEVTLARALSRVYFTPKPAGIISDGKEINKKLIRKIIGQQPGGYLAPDVVGQLLDVAGIIRAKEVVLNQADKLENVIGQLGLPVVMKVVGPVHKSDVGGVALNIDTSEKAHKTFRQMMKIKGVTGILVQPMLSGTELFAGAIYEEKFGHMILFGLGGIFIEVFKDTRALLTPFGPKAVREEIKHLKSYKIIEGVRGMEGVNQELMVEVIVRLNALIGAAPEIIEMDLNPLLGSSREVIAVDARIKIQK